FTQLARRLDRSGRVRFAETSAEVFEEIRGASEGRPCDYSGMTYERIEARRGIQWPCNSAQPDGSKRLYADGRFRHADQKAKLIPLPFVDNNERPDDAYPFWLNSGRVVEHWHTRTKTGKIGNLNKFSPTPYMEMNPAAAARFGVKPLEYVRVCSRRASAVVLVQLTERVAADTVFIPMHFHNCVNRLALGLLDPYSRQPAFKQSAVQIEKIADQEGAAQTNVTARRY
ncbi:MAG: molybdopterin oxidoreductase family protein, partial [Nitrospiria bacterium]